MALPSRSNLAVPFTTIGILLDMVKFSLGADVIHGAILLPVKYATPERAWEDPYPAGVKLFDAIFLESRTISIAA